jgi:hypothetical protein
MANIPLDIKIPPNNAGREAFPVSRPGVGFEGNPQVDKWAEAPSSGTFVLAAINGTIQWIATEACD